MDRDSHEIWKAIEESGGNYEVSNLGRIRNAETKRIRIFPQKQKRN